MDANVYLSLEEAKKIIYSVNLQPVIERLVHVDHWSKRDAEEATKQYRNYLFLRRKYSDLNLPPSIGIDEVWHAHVLHTLDYRNFCKQVFSAKEDQYLDHHPHLTKEGSLEKLEKLFEQTQNLYYKEFSEYIYQIKGRSFFRKILDKVREYLVIRFPRMTDALKQQGK